MTDAEVLSRYLSLPFDWNAAASREAIEKAERKLQMPLPEAIQAIYQRHDGTSGLVADWAERLGVTQDEDDLMNFSPRLLSLAEVTQFFEATSDFMNPEVRFFWTDDQSNYLGVYVAGPLLGAVCLLHHEVPNSSPRFRDVMDFLKAVLERPTTDVFDSYEFPTTYPALSPDPVHAVSDWAKARAMFARVEDHQDGSSQALATAMTLTPYEQSEVLVPYLDSPDFWVAERAVDILGARRYAPARPQIEWLAQHGKGNPKLAAQLALRCWDHPELPRPRPLG